MDVGSHAGDVDGRVCVGVRCVAAMSLLDTGRGILGGILIDIVRITVLDEACRGPYLKFRLALVCNVKDSSTKKVDGHGS